MQNILKLKLRHISLITFSLFFSLEIHAQQCLPPQQQVENLYKQYVLKTNQTSVQYEKKPILKKYFTENLATKLDNENKCQAKTDLICNLDYDILTDAQDVPEHPRYLFKQLNPSQVQTTITGTDYKKKVLFVFATENNCSKINNIIYQEGRSLNKILK